MNKYLVLKEQSVKGKTRTAVVVDLDNAIKQAKDNKVHVCGNLPSLYHGMIINLDVVQSKNGRSYFAQDYELEWDEHLISVLKKGKVDIDKYKRTLENHIKYKSRGISWDDAATELENIYDTLPFAEADVLHKERVNNAKDPKRLSAMGREVLACARKRRRIDYTIEEYLSLIDGVEREGAYDALLTGIKMMCLQAQKFGLSGNHIWDKEIRDKEIFIKDNVAERINSEYPLLAEKEIEYYIKVLVANEAELAEEQKNVLYCLQGSNPCVVTGGAGVGKTTVIKTVIGCYSYFYSDKDILLIAPTGKASRRLASKTGHEASTIHRALRKCVGDSFVYYNSRNPLPHKLVIVDEASMLDTELMYDLLSAVQERSKIIFVGDHNQLYPVGCGEPFFEFLELMPVYELKENHRQAEGTDILREANNVLKGYGMRSGRGIEVNYCSWSDIGHILNKEYVCNDDREHIQILSPYNAVNDSINSYLRVGDDAMNVGDKIIFLRNTEDYCNGDIGKIIKIKKDGIVAEVNGINVLVAPSSYKDISLAYAITVHKMQGSEEETVLLFIPKGDRMTDTHLLYTALTRARTSIKIYYYDDPPERVYEGQ